MEKKLFEICIKLAFQSGQWAGEVDLEERMERLRGTHIMFVDIPYIKRTTMPLKSFGSDNQVMYSLRSEDWRSGVRERCKSHMDNLLSIYEDEVSNKRMKRKHFTQLTFDAFE